jgi:hypothetical protein
MTRTMLGQAGIVVVAVLLGGGVTFAGRGGAAHVSRGAARSSVSHVSRNVGGDFNRNVNMNRNVNVNRNVDVNRNVNHNSDFDRDVDIDVDHHYGGWGCCYHPGAAAAATAAAVTTAAVTTAAVVGSMVHSLPSSCEAVSVNGFTYQRCGSTWYQPQFSGSSVTYIVVNPPR